MRKYTSKIGLEIIIFLVLIIGGLSGLMIYSKIWSGLAVMLGVLVFIIYIFSTTFYIISDENLIIKSGFLVNKTISINSIQEISRSNNPVSSPALSLDRLKINYGDGSSILISPKNIKKFVNHITEINSKIRVRTK